MKKELKYTLIGSIIGLIIYTIFLFFNFLINSPIGGSLNKFFDIALSVYNLVILVLICAFIGFIIYKIKCKQ